jgi:hypothetical protein
MDDAFLFHHFCKLCNEFILILDNLIGIIQKRFPARLLIRFPIPIFALLALTAIITPIQGIKDNLYLCCRSVAFHMH